MLLGELLVSRGYVTPGDTRLALAHQQKYGGRIGDSFIALGLIDRTTLEALIHKQYELVTTILNLEKSVAAAKRIKGSNHPTTNRERYHLAHALLAAGDVPEANKVAHIALAGLRESVGPEHTWAQDCTQLVAEARAALNGPSKPKHEVIETTVASAAAELARRHLHPNHRITISISD